MPRPRLVMQIAGGLGNQLFQYATGRAIAARSGIPLTVDHLSAFPRDFYKRKFQLDLFNVRCESIKYNESYANTLGRIKRRLYRRMNRGRPLERKFYIEEGDEGYHSEILDFKVHRRVFMEGYWQHEQYFTGIRPQLLEELMLSVDHDAANKAMAEKIRSVNAVCLHVRRLHGVPNVTNAAPLANDPTKHLGTSYYDRAIAYMMERLDRPHFFVFADFPDWARENIKASAPLEFVAHNGSDKDYEDFWLMGQCRHFVIANSTFSWWPAWLSDSPGKVIVAPLEGIPGPGLKSVPAAWHRL